MLLNKETKSNHKNKKEKRCDKKMLLSKKNYKCLLYYFFHNHIAFEMGSIILLESLKTSKLFSFFRALRGHVMILLIRNIKLNDSLSHSINSLFMDC